MSLCNAAQGVVVLVIFETEVNAGSVEIFSQKTYHFVPKTCKARLRIENLRAIKPSVHCDDIKAVLKIKQGTAFSTYILF